MSLARSCTAWYGTRFTNRTTGREFAAASTEGEILGLRAGGHQLARPLSSSSRLEIMSFMDSSSLP